MLLLGQESQRCCLLLQLLLCGFLPLLGMIPVRAAQLQGLTPLALACFQSGQLNANACQSALLRAEALQRRAGAQSNYPCQTLLLGLQADVLMSQLRAGRGDDAVIMLEEVSNSCRGL